MSLLPLLPGGPGGPGEPCLPGGPSCPFSPEEHKQVALLKLHYPMKTVAFKIFPRQSVTFLRCFNLQFLYFYTICDEDCSIVTTLWLDLGYNR